MEVIILCVILQYMVSASLTKVDSCTEITYMYVYIYMYMYLV